MSTILHQFADKTVADIAARDALPHRPDNLVVVVIDASADANVGTGVATYRWTKHLLQWLLIAKETVETVKFATEQITIANTTVLATNIPINNEIWDIKIFDGSILIAELKIEDIQVQGSHIGGLAAWDGKSIRFTYAYGTFAQQLDVYLEERMDSIRDNVTAEGDTLQELYDLALLNGDVALFNDTLI